MGEAGADYDLELLWAVLVASIVAFTLQEGAVCDRHRAISGAGHSKER